MFPSVGKLENIFVRNTQFGLHALFVTDLQFCICLIRKSINVSCAGNIRNICKN